MTIIRDEGYDLRTAMPRQKREPPPSETAGAWWVIETGGLRGRSKWGKGLVAEHLVLVVDTPHDPAVHVAQHVGVDAVVGGVGVQPNVQPGRVQQAVVFLRHPQRHERVGD